MLLPSNRHYCSCVAPSTNQEPWSPRCPIYTDNTNSNVVMSSTEFEMIPSCGLLIDLWLYLKVSAFSRGRRDRCRLKLLQL